MAHLQKKDNTHYNGLDWIINVVKNGFDNHPICIQIPNGKILQSFSLRATSGDVAVSHLQTQKERLNFQSGGSVHTALSITTNRCDPYSGDIHLAHAKLTDCNYSCIR